MHDKDVEALLELQLLQDFFSAADRILKEARNP